VRHRDRECGGFERALQDVRHEWHTVDRIIHGRT
jgi:hypothetical protein